MILVGHSYGGVVVTEAGNDPKVVGLVYIAGFALDAGESIAALSKNAPAGSPTPSILPPQDGFLFFDKAHFHADFAADLSDSAAAFMASSQVPLSLASFTDAVITPAWKSKPSWALIPQQDKVIGPVAETFMAKRAGAKITTIDGSHAVYVSHPEAVAKLIETAATTVKLASK